MGPRWAGLALLGVGSLALRFASGVPFWLALTLAAVGLGLLVVQVLPGGRRLAGLPLVLGSVCVALLGVEVVLLALERSAERPLPPPGSEAGARYRAFEAAAPSAEPSMRLPPEIHDKIERMQAARVMPRGWEKRKIAELPDRHDPYYWHGALHVFDENRMRWDRPFPPKQEGRRRILAVGDSFTYGQGIDAFWSYPAQLERMLEGSPPVEVLNLGVPGRASEDVLEVVRSLVPVLEPDFVVYGMCLNDFLPSKASEWVAWPFPLPKGMKRSLRRRSRVGRLVDERYGALLTRLGLRPDFYDELLAGFPGYRRRFERDVRAMNGFVVEQGLPPVVAMVLDPRPRWEGPGRTLALAAEAAMEAAGMVVVESENYYRRHDGRDFRVSRWDAHANEEANAIFASRFAAALRGRPEWSGGRGPDARGRGGF